MLTSHACHNAARPPNPPSPDAHTPRSLPPAPRKGSGRVQQCQGPYCAFEERQRGDEAKLGKAELGSGMARRGLYKETLGQEATGL